ncbi:37S ribosomal protein S9, mitochondrial [Gracilariopsis chorda]|uniref:37S ribosomal protein S9, mitochondrial n=1 Tax=Gracilariopsis chorda TaxID=448386 RepID=A0A2V3IWV1_9FLOR|nr:37S ribosomal protein S9, mitochondrial [Gracilariopsis chorda]|eukprot:PXF46545.1 37S ribosomal protein S9, mitochondrial [Gracilariopsis chorda]
MDLRHLLVVVKTAFISGFHFSARPSSFGSFPSRSELMLPIARGAAIRAQRVLHYFHYRRSIGAALALTQTASVHASSIVQSESGVTSPGATSADPSKQASASGSDLKPVANVLHFPDPTDPKQNPLAELAAEEVRTAEAYWKKVQSTQQKHQYRQELNEYGEAHAIGRRKRSRARIWLTDGEGHIVINNQSWVDYFPRIDHRDKVLKPLDLLGMIGKMDIRCDVKGGGTNGQAEAIRHGIARALQKWDPNMRSTLKSNGLLTRDSRVVESKKYGRKKARKSFQWVKR